MKAFKALVYAVCFLGVGVSTSAHAQTAFEQGMQQQQQLFDNSMDAVRRLGEQADCAARRSAGMFDCNATLCGRLNPDLVSNSEIIAFWFEVNDICRGSSDYESACNCRNQIDDYLKYTRNLCYGRESQFAVEYQWHQCTYDSY